MKRRESLFGQVSQWFEKKTYIRFVCCCDKNRKANSLYLFCHLRNHHSSMTSAYVQKNKLRRIEIIILSDVTETVDSCQLSIVMLHTLSGSRLVGIFCPSWNPPRVKNCNQSTIVYTLALVFRLNRITNYDKFQEIFE